MSTIRSNRNLHAKAASVSDAAAQKLKAAAKRQKCKKLAEKLAPPLLGSERALAKAIAEVGKVRINKNLGGKTKTVRASKATHTAAKHLERLIRLKKKYGVVYADPAWNYGRSSSVNGGYAAPQKHYSCMSTEEIAAIPIRTLAADDAVLYLWIPNSLLIHGIAVMKVWGFKYKTSIVWGKPNHCPTSGVVLPTHETLLVGVRGKGVRCAAGERRIRSLYTTPAGSPRLRHSEKPAHFAAEIARVHPDAKKIELFARTRRRGWTVWGNQSSPGTTPLASSQAKPTARRRAASKVKVSV